MEDRVHFMVDIETMSIHVNALILSVGVVAFDIKTGKVIEPHFYRVVDMEDQSSYHRVVDASTLSWWLSRDDDGNLRAEQLVDMFDEEESHPLDEVLRDLGLMIREHQLKKTINPPSPEPKKIMMWAKSPQFDLSVLKSAYEDVQMMVPWTYKDEMDLRTLMSLYDGKKIDFKIPGQKHNALHDAMLQAKICSHVYNHLKGK